MVAATKATVEQYSTDKKQAQQDALLSTPAVDIVQRQVL